MSKHLKIDLVGGVGNQLFSYCAGNYLALQKNLEVQVRLMKPSFGDFSHSSCINDFNIHPKVLELSTAKSVLLRLGIKIRAFFSNNLPTLKSILNSNIYVSKVVGFDENLISTDAKVIRGYFQTYLYIDAILEQNPNFLQLKLESPSDWFKELNSQISSISTIGIHVRGGDYLRKTNSNIGNLSSAYYKRAITMISEHTDLTSFRVFVFTDDIEHAKSLMGGIKGKLNLEYIVPPKNSKSVESLILMSNMNIRIISNSTFAWWAGYIGTKEGFVISPSKWFKGMPDPSHLIPSNWEVCESDWIENTAAERGRF